jgi:hypothetical protein
MARPDGAAPAVARCSGPRAAAGVHLRPQGKETVVAMCQRFDALCMRLGQAGMAPALAPRVAIQHFVKNLKEERPAWTVIGYLQGLWQVLPANTAIKRFRAGQVMQGSGLRKSFGVWRWRRQMRWHLESRHSLRSTLQWPRAPALHVSQRSRMSCVACVLGRKWSSPQWCRNQGW